MCALDSVGSVEPFIRYDKIFHFFSIEISLSHSTHRSVQLYRNLARRSRFYIPRTKTHLFFAWTSFFHIFNGKVLLRSSYVCIEPFFLDKLPGECVVNITWKMSQPNKKWKREKYIHTHTHTPIANREIDGRLQKRENIKTVLYSLSRWERTAFTVLSNLPSNCPGALGLLHIFDSQTGQEALPRTTRKR